MRRLWCRCRALGINDAEFHRYTLGQILGILHCLDRHHRVVPQGIAQLSTQFHNAWFLGKDDKVVSADELYPDLFPDTAEESADPKSEARAQTMMMLTQAILDGAEIPQEELDRIKAQLDGE